MADSCNNGISDVHLARQNTDGAPIFLSQGDPLAMASQLRVPARPIGNGGSDRGGIYGAAASAGGCRNGYRQDPRLFDSGNSLRAARSRFDGHQEPAGAALL